VQAGVATRRQPEGGAEQAGDVRLVGVEHDDLARPAVLDAAPLVEGLDAGLGHADGVGVVPVPRESATAEPGA
jgi:hypothetical protein